MARNRVVEIHDDKKGTSLGYERVRVVYESGDMKGTTTVKTMVDAGPEVKHGFKAVNAIYPLLGFLFGVLSGGFLWLNIAINHPVSVGCDKIIVTKQL